MKIMLDSNAFDKMQNLDDLEKIVACDKYEYFITSIQIEEIGNIPDEKKEARIRNLLTLCKIRAKLLFVPAVLDHARVGLCSLVDKHDIYSDLLNPSRNNIHDAMIGSAAKRENCIVVTNDVDFIKKLHKHSIQTMRYEEFIDSL